MTQTPYILTRRHGIVGYKAGMDGSIWSQKKMTVISAVAPVLLCLRPNQRLLLHCLSLLLSMLYTWVILTGMPCPSHLLQLNNRLQTITLSPNWAKPQTVMSGKQRLKTQSRKPQVRSKKTTPQLRSCATQTVLWGTGCSWGTQRRLWTRWGHTMTWSQNNSTMSWLLSNTLLLITQN